MEVTTVANNTDSSSSSDSVPSMAVVASQLEKTVMAHNGQLTILSGLDLQIKSGESVAIVGVSGSGKSTLLSLLAGLDLPTLGEVTLAGHPLNGLNEDERAVVRGQYTGFVFQSFQLLPNLTALENVMLPMELAGTKNAKQNAGNLLSRVSLDHRLTHYPQQLSGGEQQRVAIARAFAGEPNILFADEPTGNLDEKTGASIIELLFEVNRERQTTLVLVTHDLTLARRCDRVLNLRNGRLEESL